MSAHSRRTCLHDDDADHIYIWVQTEPASYENAAQIVTRTATVHMCNMSDAGGGSRRDPDPCELMRIRIVPLGRNYHGPACCDPHQVHSGQSHGKTMTGVIHMSIGAATMTSSMMSWPKNHSVDTSVASTRWQQKLVHCIRDSP